MRLGKCQACDRINFVSDYHGFNTCNSCIVRNIDITNKEWEELQKRKRNGNLELNDILRVDIKREDFWIFQFTEEKTRKLREYFSGEFEKIRRESRLHQARAIEASKHIYLD